MTFSLTLELGAQLSVLLLGGHQLVEEISCDTVVLFQLPNLRLQTVFEAVLHEPGERLAVGNAIALLRDTDDTVGDSVHCGGLKGEEVLERRYRREQSDWVVHVEGLHQVPDRVLRLALSALTRAECLRKPRLVAPRRQTISRFGSLGRRGPPPQLLDRRLLNHVQMETDRAPRRSKIIVDAPRHLARVGRVSRDDEQRDSELLATLINILRRLKLRV